MLPLTQCRPRGGQRPAIQSVKILNPPLYRHYIPKDHAFSGTEIACANPGHTFIALIWSNAPIYAIGVTNIEIMI